MSVVLHERGTRMRMTFAGDGAKAALGGLVTNDVLALKPGEGQRAAALTAKGRVIALCRVFDRGADLLVDCDAAAADGFVAMIRKYVNPRLARYTVVTDATDCLGVHGPLAAGSIVHALGADAAQRDALEALPPHGNISIGDGEDAVTVARADDLAVPGFDLFGSRARIGDIRAALVAQGLRTLSAEEARVLRVERGLPEWGAEMDAETIPQEALLDEFGAISFSKGCYTGQEVVARIHFRGHVNRHLRWIVSGAPLRAGMRVLDATGADVGEVRAAVISETRGPIAIAMVRREVEPGAAVTARDDAGAVTGTLERIGTTGANSTAHAPA